MANVGQDVRYATRVLKKAPAFTLLAVAVLAIGIGANAAIFSLVDALLLRPLPFHEPTELVKLWEHPPGYAHNSVSPLNFLDWSEQNQVFTSMTAISGGSRVLSNPHGSPERIPGQSVSVSFFDVLGIAPVAGRTFAASDVRNRNVVVIGERLWRGRFGADAGLVGRPILLDGESFTVIGVVPARFQILYQSDLWTPFIVKRSPEQRQMHYLQVIARLKPGVAIEQARAAMKVVAENIARVSPETNKDWTITVAPLREALVGRELRVTSLVLGGIVAFVLLMACANIANLLLARGAARWREIAVRSSLGGTRARITAQLLTESVLLAAMGGAAGLTLAVAVVRSAPAFLPPDTLPAGIIPEVDARILLFSAGITLATGILFGLAPAWQAGRLSIAEALRSGGRTLTGATGWFRAALAAGQIAIAVVLVTGAGLLLRTLVSINRVDPGFHAPNVLTMNLQLPLKRYPSPEDALRLYEAIEHEIDTLPGVRSVGFGTNLPADGWDIGQGFEVIGRPASHESLQPAAHYQMVSPRYFRTLGIPIVAGRSFNDRDTPSAAQVCIVNQEFVRRYLQGLDPLTARVKIQAMNPKGPTPVVRDIVGVSEQVRVEGLAEHENAAEVYVPLKQNPWYGSVVAIQAVGDPGSLVNPVKAAIARVDKDQPVTRVRTMDEVVAESVAQPRFRAELVSAFALLALTLASVGVFGVIAFAVSQRTREFGIRTALGARPSDVVRLVMSNGLRITAAGVACGLIGAAALTRSLQALLFGVTASDPFTFVMAPAVLAAVALAACIAPAFRASRVDPAVTLRQE